MCQLRLRLYRLLPLPDRWKLWLAWFISPRHRLGAHAIIRDEARRILVLQPSYTREVQLPGGTVNYREPTIEGVKREVLEELGTELLDATLIGWQHDPATAQIRAIYSGTVNPNAIQLSPEHTAYAFIPSTRLPESLRSVLNEVIQLA